MVRNIVRKAVAVAVGWAFAATCGAAAAGPASQASAPELARAVGSLAAARDALAGLLERRVANDAAKAPAVDVVLDLTEALTSYANLQNRPMPGTAPQWRDIVGQSLSRIGKKEFAPGREDVQLSFQQRGGRWFGPHMGMLSSKFRQAYHPRSCDQLGLKATDAGVAGGFALTSVWGDRRYDMHFSGESTSCTIAEFRQWKDSEGGTFWADWWVGARERLRPWTQRFTIDAAQRRGWLLKAALLAPADALAGSAVPDLDFHVWIEDGRILRGYAIVPGKLPGRGPEVILSLGAWSVKDKAMEAEFVVGVGATKRICRLRAALPDAEAGRFTGAYHMVGEKGETDGVAAGTLYRAFAGAYTTDSVDGRWTKDVLAGVAPATPAKIELATPTATGLAQVVEVYEQVAALDWALREYPLPPADALRGVRLGLDDRYTYYPANLSFYRKATQRDVPPKAPAHMHQALADSLGAGSAGAAEYAAGLVRAAQAALADRQAEHRPAVGIPEASDPDFLPAGNARMMDRAADRGNLLPAAGEETEADWRLLGDWTCLGFIQRTSSFDAAPYMPEIAVSAALRPGGAPLEIGRPVRIPNADPGEHLWAWRANGDPVDGQVTIPRDCLLALKTKAVRGRWGGAKGTGIDGETLDYYYHNLVTWYATTTIRTEKARRVWLALTINWDGRLWVNDRLVWRPNREHTPGHVAVIPVDLKAGENRLTICCSRRPTEDGNNGNLGALTFKYGEKSFGTFAVWVAGSGRPRTAEAVAAALEKERAGDKERAAAQASRGIRGRRGDGTGRYPDAKPPVAWDIAKGINIRWKKSIPTDDAEPVIVGKRLFVTTYTGEVVCLDAMTGAELWRKKPEAKGDAPAAPYPPQAVTSTFAMSSLMWGPPAKPLAVKPHAALSRSCLTPLADGRQVWAHDPRGVVACFDHEGRQIWAQAVAAQVPRFTEGGYVATRVLPLTHPAIIGQRLVVAAGEGLAALDLDRGAVLWQRPKLDWLGQFAVMDLGGGPGGQLVLLSSAEVLDAATGETLIARCAPLIPDAACEPVVDGRIAYFHAASSAVRFWRTDGGKVRCRLLWDSPTDIRRRQHDTNHGNFNGPGTPEFFCQGAYPPTPVLHDGLLFTHMAEPTSISHGPQNSMRLQIYDGATGCAVAQRYCLQINAMRPVTSPAIAGGMVFCADEGGNRPGNYPNFPEVPAIAVVTAEEQPRRITSDQPGLPTISPPVFDGRRMYLAGEDQVICIARPDELGDRFSEHELAALRDCFLAREIGVKPGPPSGAEIPLLDPPAGLTVGKGVPVVPLESGKTLGRWLFGGPFAVDEKADVLSSAGGAGAARPEEGLKVAYTTAKGARGEETFAPLNPKHNLGRDSAEKYRNPRLDGGVEFASATGRKYLTTCYLYAVLENKQPGYYRADYSTKKMKRIAVYLAGRPLEPGGIVQLQAGRYPVMVHAAIGVVQSHEPLEWYFQFVAVTAAEAMHGPQPLVPAPLAKLPAGLRTPVVPLLFAGVPSRMLGAWPLPDQALADPYAAMTGQVGLVVVEGAKIAVGGRTAEFRPVPGEAIVAERGQTDSLSFNMPAGAWPGSGFAPTFGLADKVLFADLAPARGLLFAVLANRRSLTVELHPSANVRCWLSGLEVKPAKPVRLVAGLYPFLIEYRPQTAEKAPAPTFQEIGDPAIELERWYDRVRRNVAMLRAIAAGGPGGAPAQAAIDALAAGDKTSNRPAP